MTRLTQLIFPTLLAVAAASASAAEDSFSPENGLLEISDSRLDAVYAVPDAEFSAFRDVFIEEPSIEFKKTWLREQNRYRSRRIQPRDVERIQSDLAELVRETFAAELTDAGYQLVNEAGPGVLVLRLDIVELDIVAPDTPDPGRVFRYSESAGEMTLALELSDGATGEVLVQARDRKRDFRQGWLEWRNRVSNRATARRMLADWARTVLAGISEADWSRSG